MCRATVGATPVKRWTTAASAIFSYGLRGTPSWANTLNRVPELAYAQDAVSMRCARSACLTRDRVCGARSVIGVSQLVFQVEHFGEDVHVLVGPAGFKEFRHLRLPAGVDVGGVHSGQGGGEVIGAQVADE